MGHGWPVTACPRSRAGAREPERSEGRTPGQGLFGSFCGCLTKGTRRKGETSFSVNRECWICTPCDSCFAMRPHLCRVHIHSICHDFLRVPPLRRVTFSKRRKSKQKGLPYHTAASPQARRFPHSGTVMRARRDGPSMAHRGWRGVLPRHPHNSTCVRPSMMGIRVVWTYVWLQQKQNASQTPQSLAQNVLAPTNKSLTRNEGCDRHDRGASEALD